MKNNTPILAEDLKVILSGNNILKGVSLEVKKNSFVGIIGPNGSGKSTMLKCIYRTLSPDEGTVYLNGEPLHSLPTRESAKIISVVAQHNYYNFEFSVLEVVMMGRSPHKKVLERDNEQDYRIAYDSLTKVGMRDFAHRSFSTLSGGEQQRVILARALTQQTPCLVLDEPTNHLDITHQLELMKIVKNLDVTVISAIHDLNIAAAFCDYIHVMKDGKLIHHGTPEEVLQQDFLKEIYEIDTEIVHDHRGKMHILFLS